MFMNLRKHWVAEEEENPHNQRFAGINSPVIPFGDNHVHVIFTNTGFSGDIITGPPLPAVRRKPAMTGGFYTAGISAGRWFRTQECQNIGFQKLLVFFFRCDIILLMPKLRIVIVWSANSIKKLPPTLWPKQKVNHQPAGLKTEVFYAR
jgi:hypothetical protein